MPGMFLDQEMPSENSTHLENISYFYHYLPLRSQSLNTVHIWFINKPLIKCCKGSFDFDFDTKCTVGLNSTTTKEQLKSPGLD